jgi:hypothetical protein
VRLGVGSAAQALAHVRQVAVARELGERRHRPPFVSLGHRVGAEADGRPELLGLAARLVNRHVAEAAELHLPAPPAVVGVAEVEGGAVAPALGDEARVSCRRIAAVALPTPFPRNRRRTQPISTVGRAERPVLA